VEDRQGVVRFVGGRARIVIGALLTPLLALMLILGGTVIATNADTWAAALGFLILPPLIIIGGILIRAWIALDLTIGTDVLTYRTTFRTRTFPRPEITSCGVDEVWAAYGTSKAMRPFLLMHDGRKVPLRIFGCFKPNPEVEPNPRWFREMNELVGALQSWLEAIHPS
jgi:hypothetical protein